MSFLAKVNAGPNFSPTDYLIMLSKAPYLTDKLFLKGPHLVRIFKNRFPKRRIKINISLSYASQPEYPKSGCSQLPHVIFKRWTIWPDFEISSFNTWIRWNQINVKKSSLCFNLSKITIRIKIDLRALSNFQAYGNLLSSDLGLLWAESMSHWFVIKYSKILKINLILEIEKMSTLDLISVLLG